MKTKNLVQLVLSGFIIMMISLSACKKDRVPQDDYQNLDSFYNQYKEEEQEYIIDSTGSCPLICKKGTKLCAGADLLMYTNGTGINYPFTLKVVELYSIKDMLLWRLPAIAGGNILETSAEIRVRAFKGTDELVLKPGKKYYMEMDTMPGLNNNMEAYYGYDSGTITDWTNNISSISPGFVDTLSSVTVNSYFYTLNVARAGWVSSARLHSSPAQTTTIAFTSAGTNTQNIEIYFTFTGYKGLMKVTNLTSGAVPVGEQVTLTAFAKNQNNDFLLQQSTFTVVANMQITLTMQTISEAGLLSALEAL